MALQPDLQLDLDAFAPAGSSGVHAPMPRLAEQPAAIVGIVNGRVTGIDVDDPTAASGVTVGPVHQHPDGEAILGSLTADAGDCFTVLNDAFAPEPLLIDVPRGVTMSRPVVVAHHSVGNGGRNGTGAACFPRLFVRVGENAEARVLDIQSSERASDPSRSHRLLVCPTVELDVAACGRLRYLNLQTLGSSAWQIGSQLARAGRDATIVAGTAAFGAGYARSRADTRLVGRGAHGELISLYFADGSQTLDFRTYQDHAAPDTTSNLFYKGVVADRSRSVYTGLIRIRPEARGSNAFQTNSNLKIGDDAWARSVPNLEIENNDVRCSHASTVSPIDEDQRFYLESRGVPTADANRLIVAGFLGEVVESLPLPSAAEAIRREVTAKLKAVERAGASSLAAAAGP